MRHQKSPPPSCVYPCRADAYSEKEREDPNLTLTGPKAGPRGILPSPDSLVGLDTLRGLFWVYPPLELP